jgi:hypothetical protein
MIYYFEHIHVDCDLWLIFPQELWLIPAFVIPASLISTFVAMLELRYVCQTLRPQAFWLCNICHSECEFISSGNKQANTLSCPLRWEPFLGWCAADAHKQPVLHVCLTWLPFTTTPTFVLLITILYLFPNPIYLLPSELKLIFVLQMQIRTLHARCLCW